MDISMRVLIVWSEASSMDEDEDEDEEKYSPGWLIYLSML